MKLVDILRKQGVDISQNADALWILIIHDCKF